MRTDLLDQRPIGGVFYPLMCLLVIFAAYAIVSHSDYIDGRREECATRQLDYDATADVCVAYPDR